MKKYAKKYELTDETIEVDGIKLFRIRALRDFGNVRASELGGFVESEKNLSHVGSCWIVYNACVFGNAIVSGDACVSGDAVVCGDAHVYGDAVVYGDARVFGNAVVSGKSRVYGKAHVSGDACVSGDAVISGEAWIRGNAVVSGDALLNGNVTLTGNTDWALHWTRNPDDEFFDSGVFVKDAVIQTREDFIRAFPEWCI